MRDRLLGDGCATSAGNSLTGRVAEAGRSSNRNTPGVRFAGLSAAAHSGTFGTSRSRVRNPPPNLTVPEKISLDEIERIYIWVTAALSWVGWRTGTNGPPAGRWRTERSATGECARASRAQKVRAAGSAGSQYGADRAPTFRRVPVEDVGRSVGQAKRRFEYVRKFNILRGIETPTPNQCENKWFCSADFALGRAMKCSNFRLWLWLPLRWSDCVPAVCGR